MPPTHPPVSFAPPYCNVSEVANQLRQSGFALLRGTDVAHWCAASMEDLQDLAGTWDGLPADAYLLDGGRYRSRRHTCFEVLNEKARAVQHRAHWQPLEYNALHGGIERWFEPMTPSALANPALGQLLQAMGTLCEQVFPDPERARDSWFVEAHQFRIDTAGGIGRPTPEGAHRDGVDLVAVFLVARCGVKGGETRIFEASSPAGQRFTLTEPWSVLLLDDARMVHETTPIQPQIRAQEQEVPEHSDVKSDAPLVDSGYRDTLVVTWRRRAFQGPEAAEKNAA